MKAIEQQKRLTGMIIVLIGCLLLFSTPLVAAQNNSSEMSNDEPLFIQGSVKRISLKKKIITLKPSKQERVEFKVDEHTDFIRMSALEELKKGQRLKVWYTAVGNEKRAVKIEKLPDLGC